MRLKVNIQPINTVTNYMYKTINPQSICTYSHPQSIPFDTVSFSGFKKAPNNLSNKIVNPNDKFKTDKRGEYHFSNSIIKAQKRTIESADQPQIIIARIINATDCSIERNLEAPDINLKNTQACEVRAGNINMSSNSSASLVDLKSQTIAHANIFDSNVDCLALYTNDPIKGGKSLLDNDIVVNNSTVKKIRYPYSRPSQNNFYISNNSHVGPMDFYNIVHKQVIDVSDSSVESFIDSKLPMSKVKLHNVELGELRCDPKNLQISGHNQLGDVTLSCYHYEPGENIEITIPTGTSINGNLYFEQTTHIPGANYIINVEEGANLHGDVFVLDQNPHYGNQYTENPKCIEDKNANVTVNKNVKPKPKK